MSCSVESSSSSSLPAIAEDAELLNVGSIEVEAVEDSERGKVLNRIVCESPHDLNSDAEVEDQLNRSNSIVNEEEGVEITQSILDSIASTFMNTCGGCQNFYPKSALRKKSDSRPPAVPMSERTVSFSSLEIREFNMTLGDHPSAISGPPVALDWDQGAGARVVDLDEYERARSPRRKRRQLKLSYKDRKGILQNSFSDDEINKQWREALEIRMQRKETLSRGLVLMTMDDIWESTCRKTKRLSNGISSVFGL